LSDDRLLPKAVPKRRKPYRKPLLIEVALRPEEAVLGGCKIATSGGTGPAATPCANYACVTNGS